MTSADALWMSESDLRIEIYKLCAQFNLRYIHHPDSRRADGRGWPDLTILGPSGAYFRELKSARGTIRPDQRRVGSLLAAAGLDWAVWRPVHLMGGTIARQLEAIT